MDSENLATIYHEKINTEEDAGKILAQFYWALFEKQYNTKEVILFRKLVKLYGKETAFTAILDLYSMPSFDGKPDNLLFYFCKKNFQTESPPTVYFNPDELVQKLNKARKVGKNIVQSRE